MRPEHFQSNKGFGAIEMLCALALALTITLGMFQVSQFSIRLSGIALERVRAGFLLQEGAEALRFLRDEDWQTRIASIAENQEYFLSFQEGLGYVVSEDPGSLIDGLFRRTVMVQPVFRDAEDDIAEFGTLDPNTKKIVVAVSWMRQGSVQDESIEMYITNSFSQ